MILPTRDIIAALKPQWVIFENVPNMQNTLIYDEDGKLVNIIDYIVARLGDDYVGKAEVVGAADYGVPQNRKRLLTIFSRTDAAKAYYAVHHSFFRSRHIAERRVCT